MFLSTPPESEDTARVYDSTLKGEGFVMNFTHAWAWRADVYEAFVKLRAQLTDNSALSKRELAVLVCATVSGMGDSYCALAWGRTLAKAVDPRSAAAVLQGGTTPELSAREQALAGWSRKVVSNPNATTAADVSALRTAGLSDREIAEATFFIAFRLAFSTVNDALGAQPDWQLAASAPPEVAAAVTFGRPVATKR
jgi:uncharacterized peroxidase-related enzyme